MGEMSPVRRRMIEDMTFRDLSPATQQSCVQVSLNVFVAHPICSAWRMFGP
jgi:hypothetical protein